MIHFLAVSVLVVTGVLISPHFSFDGMIAFSPYSEAWLAVVRYSRAYADFVSQYASWQYAFITAIALIVLLLTPPVIRMTLFFLSAGLVALGFYNDALTWPMTSAYAPSVIVVAAFLTAQAYLVTVGVLRWMFGSRPRPPVSSPRVFTPPVPVPAPVPVATQSEEEGPKPGDVCVFKIGPSDVEMVLVNREQENKATARYNWWPARVMMRDSTGTAVEAVVPYRALTVGRARHDVRPGDDVLLLNGTRAQVSQVWEDVDEVPSDFDGNTVVNVYEEDVMPWVPARVVLSDYSTEIVPLVSLRRTKPDTIADDVARMEKVAHDVATIYESKNQAA